MKFPAHAVFVEGKTGDVAARPRETIDKAGAHRIGDIHEHDRHAAGGLLQRRYSRAASGEDEIRGESDHFRRVLPRLDVACCPAGLDLHIVTASPTQLLEALPKCGDASLPFRIIRGESHEHADAPHLLGLLRAGRERPRRCCAAECGQQFPPSDGDCHTPLPCEVRKWNDTTPRACCP